MTEINPNKLSPVSTDMYVGMIGNTEKMVSSNKRWNYADNRDDKDDDDLDVNANDYTRRTSGKSNVLKKPDDDKTKKDNEREHGNKSNKTKSYDDSIGMESIVDPKSDDKSSDINGCASTDDIDKKINELRYMLSN